MMNIEPLNESDESKKFAAIERAWTKTICISFCFQSKTDVIKYFLEQLRVEKEEKED